MRQFTGIYFFLSALCIVIAQSERRAPQTRRFRSKAQPSPHGWASQSWLSSNELVGALLGKVGLLSEMGPEPGVLGSRIDPHPV
jgi:hypothetical protein